MSACPGGPATCMDDICRWSQVGWCGKDRADYPEDDGQYDDYGFDYEGLRRMKSAPTYLSSASCPQCGEMVPSPEAMRTPFGPVWKAKHEAYHFDWLAAQVGRARYERRMEAWRTYAKALEDDANRARRQDRERIIDLEAELAEVRADLQDARDALEQAEADLDHVNRFGGAT